MKAFPMFIKTSGRRVVIAGGGEQAAQKARLILKTDAYLVLAAPTLDAELQGMVHAGRATHFVGPITADLFAETALVFIASGCPAVDASLHAVAKAAGAVVNVVDRPDLCDATTPSLVDRDPVVVAIGTEGTAPVLARKIKTEVETMLSPQLGGLAALAGRLRGAVADRLPRNTRRAFWAWVFNGAPHAAFAAGREAEGARMIKDAIAARAVPETAGKGHVALVGVPGGARDLLTLRAVERLQEADVIFYDRVLGSDVLELARRDAERVAIGGADGVRAWPAAQIARRLQAEVRQGLRVVWLSGEAAGGLADHFSQSAEFEVVPSASASPSKRAA